PLEGVTVKVIQRGDCLKILLESRQAPPPQSCVQGIQDRINSLKLAAIQTVLVYGREVGIALPTWTESFAAASSITVVPSELGQGIAVPCPNDGHPTHPIPPNQIEQAPVPSLAKPWGVLCAALSGLLVLGITGIGTYNTFRLTTTFTPIQDTPIPDLPLRSLPAFTNQQIPRAELSKILRLIQQQAQAVRTEASQLQVAANLKNPVFAVPTALQGKTLYQANLRRPQKVIALTFDDGPWPHTTLQVLQILKQHQIKATFFWVGQLVQAYPEIAQQVVRSGHAVGNHTWHHHYHRVDRATAAQELNRTADSIYQTTGAKTSLFRPPGGFLDNGLVTYANQTKQSVLMWSIDIGDTKFHASSQSLANQVLSTAHPGAIVLMHDGGGNRQTTVQALPTLIKGLKQRGYRFVTIPQLLEMQAQDGLPTAPPTWLALRSPKELYQIQAKLRREVDQRGFTTAKAILTDTPSHLAQVQQYQLYGQALKIVEARIRIEEQAHRQWYTGVKFAQQAVKNRDIPKQSAALWQQSLADLQQIPTDSFWRERAEQKLKEYQQNLAVATYQLETIQSGFLQEIAQRSDLSSNTRATICQLSGQCRHLGGNTPPRSPASLIKVPIAVALLHKVKTQGISLDTPIYVHPSNFTEDASDIRVGKTYPLRALMAQMISQSSNIATNQLIDYLGLNYINQVLQEYGYRTTRVNFKLVGETTMPANAGYAANRLTSRELTSLMMQIYARKQPGDQALIQALARQKDHALGFAALKSSNAQWLGEKTGQNALALGTTLLFKVAGETYGLTVIDQGSQSELKLRRFIRGVADHIAHHQSL
ncbi:MAG: polysaccharide deacetylase family protein, partial [Leptolyngbyaceae bacterium]|nr:polysaccharide deacetylase family protein [Leptolyngbyaceae bacterium]